MSKDRWRRWSAPIVALVLAMLLAGGAAVAVVGDSDEQVLCPPGADLVVHPDGTWTCGPAPTPPSTPTAEPTTPAPTPPPPTTPAPTTSSPSPTTPAPTTTQPTVAPTTPAPTTSSPSPTPTLTGCMPQPSRCGWPDETNTGPTGPLTVRSGGFTISTAGAVVENLDIRGCVVVLARNVTIRNSKITCGGFYAVSVRAGNPNVDSGWQAADANLLLEDVEIDFAGQRNGKMIAFSGYTARRVHFHNGADCAHFGVNVTVEDSFCDVIAGPPEDGPHYDGLQSDGGRNIVLRHNTIRMPHSQTSAILMSTNTSAIRDVTIVDNLMSGGGWTLYCGTASGPVQGSFVASGNRIVRNSYRWGPTTSCPRGVAVWDDTGQAI